MTDSLAACFVCGNSDPTGAYDDRHTDFNGSPGYGSRFDMTGHLRIHVCDDCLEERKDRVMMVKVRRPKPEEEEEPWACGICGDVAHEGHCHIAHTVGFLDEHGIEEGSKDGFVIGVRDEETARGYVKRCEAHALACGLDKAIIFRAERGDHDRWVVTAAKEDA